MHTRGVSASTGPFVGPTAGRRDTGGPVAWPRPARPRLPARLAYRAQRLLAPNRLYRRFAGWLESSPASYRIFTAAERGAKRQIFGCRMCGECTLPVTGYACSMTCPKQMRNGPCGGVGADGSCEVHPSARCVWLVAWERSVQAGHTADLRPLQRPADHRLWGSSAWVGYWRHGDRQPWTGEEAGHAPAVRRSAPQETVGPR